MSTPHISASPGDFAPVVLMPGDPRRAAFIAERFLTDARQVTDVRNMLGFTGTFAGRRVSVLGHGMGIPSVSIYATELIREYGAKVLLRVGSCGAIQRSVRVRDVLIALAAGTDSNVNRTRCLGHDLPAVGDFALCRRAVDAAERLGVPVRVGTVFSSDLFYAPPSGLNERLTALGVLALEMEAAGLYGVAAEHGARALTLLTVSDHLVTGEKLSSDDRARSFEQMLSVALAVAAEES